MPEPLGIDNVLVPILRLDADGAERSREQLIDLLVDSVEHGASVNFVQPMTREKAARWWEEGASHATRASTLPLASRTTAVAEAPPTVLVRIPAFTDNRPAGDGEAQL